MTFPEICASYNPYSSLGSHVNYTIINANGILKSLCNRQTVNADQRCQSAAHLSQKLFNLLGV